MADVKLTYHPLSVDELHQLRRLWHDSTTGPWAIGGVDWEGDGSAGVSIGCLGECIALCNSWHLGERGEPGKPQARDYANAVFITTVCDMLPRMLTELEFRRAEEKALDNSNQVHYNPNAGRKA